MYKEGTSRLRLDMVNDGYPTVSILMPHGIDAPDDDDIVCSTSVEEVFSAPRPEITTGACSDEATADLAWTLVFVPFLAYGLPVAESLVPNEAESQVIDDRSANCYRTNADEFSNVCFSDGVLVSVATSNDDWRAELRTLRDLDADEDFALPFGLVD
jgi:hypothetical protein